MFPSRQDLYTLLYQSHLTPDLYAKTVGPVAARLYQNPLEGQVLDELPAGASVLEVGCGPGLQVAQAAIEYPELRFTASDISPRFLDLTRHTVAEALSGRSQANVEFVEADFSRLAPFSDGQFDAVYAFNVLKHAADPVAALQEALRVLKPGGVLFFSEFHRDGTVGEVAQLVVEMGVPALPARWVAQALHPLVTGDAPTMSEVAQWITAAGGQGEPKPLPDYPVFLARVRKAR